MPVEGRRDTATRADPRHRPPDGPSPRVDAESQLLIRLLGPVQAVVGGRPLVFPSPKARALFALLALEAGRTVSVARLVEGLWGDDPPDSATATLQAYVSRLRRLLERDGPAPGTHAAANGVTIRRQPPGYLLDVPEQAVDARLFRGLAAAAKERLDSDPLAAVGLLARALELVRGEPLADVVEQLQSTGATEAHRLVQQVLDARERHVDALLRVDDAETALLRSFDLLAEHPLRETSQALHLLALYRCGRQAEALSAYERFRRRLGDELGVDPGPQLRRLHLRLLQQDAELELVPVQRAPVLRASGAVPDSRGDTSIGREGPLSRIEAALAAADEGQGSVWLVSGEAGIGKSTLCQDVAERARRHGFVTAWGRGRGSAVTTPYWLWAQVLRTLPELSGHEDAAVILGESPGTAGSGPARAVPAHRSHLHESLARRLADHAARQRLLIILEDLHWGDPLSLELLGVVAEAAAGSPLMVVCTVRSPGPPATPALTELLARLVGEAVHEIRLTGLDPDVARRLLAGRLPDPPDRTWIEAAVAQADGNPFFLVELARLVEERPAVPGAGPARVGVPASVLAVLRDRLRSLSAATRRLLEVSAVIGREAQLSLLEQVSGMSPVDLDAALAEAVGVGFVTEQLLPTPRICFRHALVREALYEELRPVLRARLHAGVGIELATGHHDATAEDLAGHLLQGVDVAGPAAALPALLTASRRAAAQLALEHAERLLRQALALIERLPPGSDRDGWELAVQARLGSTVAVRLGWGTAQANQALERAQHLALRVEPDAEMFAALYHRISWLAVSGGFDTALTLSDVLLDRSTAPGVTGQRFELLARTTRGAVHWFRGDDTTAITELDRANELAAVLGPDLAEAFREHPQTPVLGFLAHALTGAGRRSEGAAVARRSLVLARQSYPAEAGSAVMFAALLAAARPDQDAAKGLADELSELAAGSSLGLHAVTADIIGSWSVATSPSTSAEQAEAALRALRTAVDRYLATGAAMITPIVLTLLSEAELSLGQVDRAHAAVRDAIRAGKRGMPSLWRQRLGQLSAAPERPASR